MRYIALLRAINVGGNRIVKMEALRQMLAELGLTEISSYIQSGNVSFEAPDSDPEALARRIEAHLQQATGFAIPTTLRTPAELAEINQELPPAGADERLNIHFLGGPHDPAAGERLQALAQEGLSLWLRPRELILLTRRDLADKRLASGNWLEKQLGTWLTARNANTVRKLYQLVSE
ncbi:MAG: DUF1697 domain-containing protein [Candidatus Sericytochromatia bacterium]